MKIYYDDNPNGPTIEIAGVPTELLELGRAFLRKDAIVLAGDKAPSRFYPVVMDELVFSPLLEREQLLRIAIEGQRLLLSAGAGAAESLGRSLENVFSGDVSEGQHIHLDYFEDNGLLAPTDFHLIFQCEKEI
jgi:hypothetical protein